MDPTARFVQMVHGPADALALDEAALCIAAHAYPGLDLIGQLSRLDELAASCPAPTFERLLRHLFVDEGFHGDPDRYYEPENSYLNHTLDRRVGLPITLSVLAMEVGRRIGLDVRGVGLPGHFLVSCEGRLADPYDAGRPVDLPKAVGLYRSATGSSSPFDPAWLEPMDNRSILLRILTNLKYAFVQKGDVGSLVWCLRLRTAMPGAPPQDAAELTRLMARFN
jgi:regulator of sirC expression with transglutaminase-like and TPR domain